MKRNYGIDLLRLVTMFMVILLHILGQGGVLNNTQMYSVNYGIAWAIETFAYCAVNCFAIITGFVYFKNQYKFSSAVLIWLQTVLYSVGISLCVWIIRPDLFSWNVLLNCLFPIFRNTYWYLSSYMGLFLLIPFLNKAIEAMSEKHMKNLLLLVFAVFCVVGTVGQRDPFALGGGYGTFWLVLLYILGAAIKKFDWGAKVNTCRGLLLFAGAAFLSLAFKIAIEPLTALIFGSPRYGNMFIRYTSPTIVFAAIGLFLAFKNMRLSNGVNKVVSLLSSGALGIYIIHQQKYVRGVFIEEKFIHLANLNPLYMVGTVFLAAIAIFVCCLTVDLVRHFVFTKLKLKEKLLQLEKKYLENTFQY